MQDVSGEDHTLRLLSDEGIVIWDIFRAWWEEYVRSSFPSSSRRSSVLTFRLLKDVVPR